MRPLGEVSLVLMRAATERPGTVRQLAQRTQVGYGTAKYTASRLVERGQLVRVTDQRPTVLAAPPMSPCGDALADALVLLGRSFWERGDSDGADAAPFDEL